MERVLNIEQLARSTEDRLATLYTRGEAQWLARIAFEEIKGWDRTHLLLHGTDEAGEYLFRRLGEVADRLMRYEPIQYIFGTARFYGMKFHVDRSTLIPRPETAELVDMIVDRSKKREDLRLLDICTGSGCIAIALARNLPFSRVDATDISPAALAVARRNAADLRVNVRFTEADILNAAVPDAPEYDIVVSNPPYIADRERSTMSRNVLDYEPHTALFVPDTDPLLFYRHISRYAAGALRTGGRLYLEINPIYADDTRRLLQFDGFSDVEIFPDSSRQNRFAIARK